MKYAIAFGNLVEGHVVYGPFDTPQAALDWTTLYGDDDNEILIHLLEPEEN
jgi:hypothetical protein